MIIASDAAYFLILLHSTGQDLQLPRGKGHERTSRSYTKVPHLIHPPIRIRKTVTAPGSPYSFRIVHGFFYVPQNYHLSRNCETGPPAYCPYPRRDISLISFFISSLSQWYPKWPSLLHSLPCRVFFDACDGIFLNYGWNETQLMLSRGAAGQDRISDVYVGVDVFGRGCFGGGGYNCDKVQCLYFHLVFFFQSLMSRTP